jgi:hypothetical protein
VRDGTPAEQGRRGEHETTLDLKKEELRAIVF